MAAILEKVVSGGPTEARNKAIIKTERLLPNGKHERPKARKGLLKEQQSQQGWNTERESRAGDGGWPQALEACLVRALNFRLSLEEF